MKAIKYKGISICKSFKSYSFFIFKTGCGYSCRTIKEAKKIIIDSL